MNKSPREFDYHYLYTISFLCLLSFLLSSFTWITFLLSSFTWIMRLRLLAYSYRTGSLLTLIGQVVYYWIFGLFLVIRGCNINSYETRRNKKDINRFDSSPS